jgi:hypothetical protein
MQIHTHTVPNTMQPAALDTAVNGTKDFFCKDGSVVTVHL